MSQDNLNSDIMQLEIGKCLHLCQSHFSNGVGQTKFSFSGVKMWNEGTRLGREIVGNSVLGNRDVKGACLYP